MGASYARDPDHWGGGTVFPDAGVSEGAEQGWSCQY